MISVELVKPGWERMEVDRVGKSVSKKRREGDKIDLS